MLLTEIPRVMDGIALASCSDSKTELSTERGALAKRASDLLGYRALMASVTGRPMLAVEVGPLTEALRALDLEVLDAATVIKYQIEEVARRNREYIAEHFRDWAVGWIAIAAWNRTELSSYEQPIPEFVIDKAVRIKESVPTVQFYVQHLSDPKADPFLIAALGKEIYYVEAWDEPRFEATL